MTQQRTEPARWTAYDYISRAWSHASNVDAMVRMLHDYGYEIRPVEAAEQPVPLDVDRLGVLVRQGMLILQQERGRLSKVTDEDVTRLLRGLVDGAQATLQPAETDTPSTSDTPSVSDQLPARPADTALREALERLGERHHSLSDEPPHMGTVFRMRPAFEGLQECPDYVCAEVRAALAAQPSEQSAGGTEDS